MKFYRIVFLSLIVCVLCGGVSSAENKESMNGEKAVPSDCVLSENVAVTEVDAVNASVIWGPYTFTNKANPSYTATIPNGSGKWKICVSNQTVTPNFTVSFAEPNGKPGIDGGSFTVSGLGGFESGPKNGSGKLGIDLYTGTAKISGTVFIIGNL